jgi:hypothetical protein
MRTVLSMVLLVGVFFSVALIGGCGSSDTNVVPNEDGLLNQYSPEGGGSTGTTRTAQDVPEEHQNHWWWIVGKDWDLNGIEPLIVGLSNTQENVVTPLGVIDYGIIAGFNYKLTPEDYVGAFMFYLGNNSTGGENNLTPLWDEPKHVPGIDWIRDLAWDEGYIVDNEFLFYCTSGERIVEQGSKIACIKYIFDQDLLICVGSWDGSYSTPLGNGPDLRDPHGIAVVYHQDEPVLFVADTDNHRVVIVGGYTSQMAGVELDSHEFPGNPFPWKPVGLSAEQVKHVDVGSGVFLDVYHVIVTFDKGTGVGAVGLYKVDKRTDEQTWYWQQQWTESQSPVNDADLLEHNIQQVETIPIDDNTMSFYVAHPTIQHSVILYWEYDFNYWGFLTGLPECEKKYVFYTYCQSKNMDIYGYFDPIYGVCGDEYGGITRIYSTGVHQLIALW